MVTLYVRQAKPPDGIPGVFFLTNCNILHTSREFYCLFIIHVLSYSCSMSIKKIFIIKIAIFKIITYNKGTIRISPESRAS